MAGILWLKQKADYHRCECWLLVAFQTMWQWLFNVWDKGYWYSFSSDMVGKDQVILNSPTNKTAMWMSSVASSVQKKKRAVWGSALLRGGRRVGRGRDVLSFYLKKVKSHFILLGFGNKKNTCGGSGQCASQMIFFWQRSSKEAHTHTYTHLVDNPFAKCSSLLDRVASCLEITGLKNSSKHSVS